MPILRVFPKRNSFTPTDEYVRIGEPKGRLPNSISEVHVSCTFTWDMARCRELQLAWSSRVNERVRLGGPAYDDPGGHFTQGRYVRLGVSISSRGCPGKCPWCFVPKREGKLRLLPICWGNRNQDNNITAFPKRHFKDLVSMLTWQQGIVLAGGLEARRLKDWHIEEFRRLKPSQVREVWFSADEDSALRPLKRALSKIRPMFAQYSDGGRRKLRCYVMIGFHESISKARDRLERVWELGCLPFAQLYRDDEDTGQDWRKKYNQEWRALERKWARPAAMFACHVNSKGDKK